MGRRLVGTVLFLIPCLCLFDTAGRLAQDQRSGWGWFLCFGLMMTGVALNIWTGEIPTPRSPHSQKPYSSHDLE
jgi:hypothetical protein